MNHSDFRATLRTLGVTQRWFANHVDVSISVVNRWALGKLPVPRYAQIVLEALKREKVG